MSAETVNTQEQSKQCQGTCAASLSSQQSISGQKACPTSATPSVVRWMVKDIGKARAQIELERQEKPYAPKSYHGPAKAFLEIMELGLIKEGRWYTTSQISALTGLGNRYCSAALCYHAKVGRVERRRGKTCMEWSFKK